jgi:hypothetical protein
MFMPFPPAAALAPRSLIPPSENNIDDNVNDFDRVIRRAYPMVLLDGPWHWRALLAEICK